MNKRQEKVLVATLCGLVITAAAGFAVQPAMASDYGQLAQVTGVADWSRTTGAAERLPTAGAVVHLPDEAVFAARFA